MQERRIRSLCCRENDRKCPHPGDLVRRIAADTTMSAKTTTSEYLLIFRNTGWHKDLSPEEIQENMARFTAWFERLSNEGRVKSGGPLLHDGKILASKNVVTDGPFAESKEAIAGFFLIQ